MVYGTSSGPQMILAIVQAPVVMKVITIARILVVMIVDSSETTPIAIEIMNSVFGYRVERVQQSQSFRASGLRNLRFWV